MSFQPDIHHMKHALTLARRGLGFCAPNPSVGCVIVKNGHVIAAARTANGGRPHAEALALKQAGSEAKGADVYVTLEPCAHHGHTGPCAEALGLAGVKRVIIGASDPDSRVCGKGVEVLKSAHIEVVENFLAEDATRVHDGFLTRVTQSRPFVALKTATTCDGKLAPSDEAEKWVTGALARRKVHQLRSQYDAILCGIGTVLADDPALTTRLPGVVHTSPRIILDSHLRIPPDSQLVKTATDVPVWVFYEDDPDGNAESLEAAGVTLYQTSQKSIAEVLEILAGQGIMRLFVEGGAQIYRQFLAEGLVDRLYWFRAPKLRGGEGAVSFPGYESPEMIEALVLRPDKTMSFGEDILEIYERKA